MKISSRNKRYDDIPEVFYCKNCKKVYKCDGADCMSNTNNIDPVICENCPIVKLFYEYIAIGNKVDALNLEVSALNNQIDKLNNCQDNIEDKADCLVFGKCKPNV